MNVAENVEIGECISGRRTRAAELLGSVSTWLSLWWSQAVIESRRDDAMIPQWRRDEWTHEADSLLGAATIVQRLLRERYAYDRTAIRRLPAVRKHYWWEKD